MLVNFDALTDDQKAVLAKSMLEIALHQMSVPFLPKGSPTYDSSTIVTWEDSDAHTIAGRENNGKEFNWR